MDSEEVRARRAAGVRARWADPEYRAMRVARVQEQWADPTYREQTLAALRAAWDDPSFQARMVESGRRQGEALHARMDSDPEFRERVLLQMREWALTRHRRCDECGLVSNPGALGMHQKHKSHIGWTDV